MNDVIDTMTNLMWSPTLGDRTIWLEGKERVEAYRGGGLDDWRLPTIKELLTLVEYGRFDPAIDIEKFPDTKSSFYWSSTPDASAAECAWNVHFYYGLSGIHTRYRTAFVRAVRSVA